MNGSCHRSAPSAALTLTGSYNELLDYVIFAVLLFYILTIAGIFVLRRTRPDMERPYKAFGYPVLPAIYVLLAAAVAYFMLVNNNTNCIRGLIIMLIGIPIYYFAVNRNKAAV